ncbi:MAG: hypothetical protein ACTHLJ_12070 [Angustibacter sp.]
MAKQHEVPRPLKKAEFTILFGTRQAEAGWTDLKATQRNALVDAWDFLTKQPTARQPKNHPLKGDLATVTHRGATHERWQHELSHGARIWFYVDGRTVVLIDCHTRHPNETK